jgi:hypothetical protein
MTQLNENRSPGVFTRKWLTVVLLSMVPLFFLFALLGDPGRGRAAAISWGMIMMAIRARWDLRRRGWFWVTAAVLVGFHAFLVQYIPWTDKSYPGYALLPVGLLDYGAMYGCIKLVEKVIKKPPVPVFPRVSEDSQGSDQHDGCNH